VYELLFLTGGRAGQVVPITRTLVAGRSADCSLVVPDPNTSRHHCGFVLDGANVVLEDRHSINGTYLNDVLLTAPATMQDGDEVRIGQTLLRFGVRKRKDEPDDATQVFSLRDMSDSGRPDKFDERTSLLMADLPARAIDERGLALRLEAIIKVSKALVNIRDFDRISHGILDALFEVFPQADRGFLMLGNDVSQLVPQAVKSRGKVFAADLVISRSICRSAIEHRRAILFNDLTAGDFTVGESVYALNIRGAMVVPLIVEDEILGVLQIDTPVQRAAFTASDLELAAAVSQQAAIALHNAFLLRKVEEESTSRTSLMRFLPGAMVEQVLLGKLDLALGGNTCHGTILFSDIVGFTGFAETLPPETVVKLMNDYFSRMVPCIENLGGAVDKFMGDAILAVWGVPLVKPDAALRAAGAALAMQNACVGLDTRRYCEDGPCLEMGIGINSGTVVAGNIGADNRVSYTVIGDAVNTAQRMEVAACRGQILISQATWAELAGSGIGIAMPPLRVKNKTGMLTVRSLRGLRTAHSEIVLHIPVRIGGDRAWLIRLLADESAILLHPETAPLASEPVIAEMQECPDLDFGRCEVRDVMPHQQSDGRLVRSQIAFTGTALVEWLRSPDLVCSREWNSMTRH